VKNTIIILVNIIKNMRKGSILSFREGKEKKRQSAFSSISVSVNVSDICSLYWKFKPRNIDGSLQKRILLD
jgi:hypothetical protein